VHTRRSAYENFVEEELYEYIDILLDRLITGKIARRENSRFVDYAEVDFWGCP